MMHLGVEFISFQQLLQELMAQAVQKEYLFDTRQTTFPLLDAVLGNMEGAASSIDAQPFVNGGQNLLHPTEWRPQPSVMF